MIWFRIPVIGSESKNITLRVSCLILFMIPAMSGGAGEYEITWYNMKRESSIKNDRIVMRVGEHDNLQQHADFAKRLIEKANRTVQRELFREIDRQINQRMKAALAEYDAIKSLKDRARDIRL